MVLVALEVGAPLDVQADEEAVAVDALDVGDPCGDVGGGVGDDCADDGVVEGDVVEVVCVVG